MKEAKYKGHLQNPMHMKFKKVTTERGNEDNLTVREIPGNRLGCQEFTTFLFDVSLTTITTP